MASHCSRSSRPSRSPMSSHRQTTMCHHGERAVLKVSGTKENLGRRFWSSAYYEVQQERRNAGFSSGLTKAKLRRTLR
ncbi:hypothetical protein PIB30_046725 [Stylosanthes scabra]|uniref:Uncharacterized protein n=1 Tax=Stylosanthes scabra TaxID=79078 RepID=A0ABU6ZFA8_9FABA|nr:hypothetical protein [Stylosanthes scabra]